MTPNDKAKIRKEANRIRSSNFRKNKETPEQADIRKKNESIRSAERRKGKLSLDDISQKSNFNLEYEDNSLYISKMDNNNNVRTKITPNDKAQKKHEANRFRWSNFRKNKETPEQADIRKKNNSIRNAERRKGKFSLDDISQNLNFNLEHEENFPYISKMVNNNDVIHRAFHHIMKTKLEPMNT